jgi:hypothetical protein
MEVEHKVVCVPIDENHQGELEALEKQGYQLIPGIPPVAVYHLARPKPAVQAEGGQITNSDGPQFKLTIDDSKIFVQKPAGE